MKISEFIKLLEDKKQEFGDLSGKVEEASEQNNPNNDLKDGCRFLSIGGK